MTERLNMNQKGIISPIVAQNKSKGVEAGEFDGRAFSLSSQNQRSESFVSKYLRTSTEQ